MTRSKSDWRRPDREGHIEYYFSVNIVNSYALLLNDLLRFTRPLMTDCQRCTGDITEVYGDEFVDGR